MALYSSAVSEELLKGLSPNLKLIDKNILVYIPGRAIGLRRMLMIVKSNRYYLVKSIFDLSGVPKPKFKTKFETSVFVGFRIGSNWFPRV